MIKQKFTIPDCNFIISYYDKKSKDEIDTFKENDALRIEFIPNFKMISTEANNLFNKKEKLIISEVEKIMNENPEVYIDIKYNYNFKHISYGNEGIIFISYLLL